MNRKILLHWQSILSIHVWSISLITLILINTNMGTGMDSFKIWFDSSVSFSCFVRLESSSNFCFDLHTDSWTWFAIKMHLHYLEADLMRGVLPSQSTVCQCRTVGKVTMCRADTEYLHGRHTWTEQWVMCIWGMWAMMFFLVYTDVEKFVDFKITHLSLVLKVLLFQGWWIPSKVFPFDPKNVPYLKGASISGWQFNSCFANRHSKQHIEKYCITVKSFQIKHKKVIWTTSHLILFNEDQSHFVLTPNFNQLAKAFSFQWCEPGD